MVKAKDETGNIYGRLAVIKEVGRKRGAVLFLCECECGNKKEITGGDLRSGKVKSCGCYKKEYLSKEYTTHGLKKHRIYNIYHGMVDRCTNSENANFYRYGGRGIKVCDEWLNEESGLLAFYEWSLSNGYDEKLTIDRIDNDGNYEPSNCRWITFKKQQNNKSTNHYVEINGETKTLKEWSEIYQISYATIFQRLKRGWSDVEAVTTPRYEKFVNKEYLL